MNKLFLLFAVLMIALLAGCGTQNAPESAATPTAPSASVDDIQVSVSQPTLEPYSFKASDPGYITVHGMLLVMNPTSLLPAPDDGIHMVPLMGVENTATIPPFEVGDVPQADVDERTGEYVFTNISPGEYAIVIRTSGGSQIPAHKMEDGALAIFEFGEEQIDTTVELNPVRIP